MAENFTVEKEGWFESLSLPEGWTFETVQTPENCTYPKLYPVVWLTIGILLLRWVLEGYILPALGRKMGVQDRKVRKLAPNANLEMAFKKLRKDLGQASVKGERGVGARHRVHEAVQGLARTENMSSRKVHAWFREKRLQELVPASRKFSESSFRCLLYMFFFSWGLLCTWDKPWMVDSSQIFEEWPKHPLPEPARWYYMMELSYYLGGLLTLPVDNKRKDFYELIIHHLVTNFLIMFSWGANFWRVGTLIMLVHDVSDIFLEAAKLFNYAKWTTASENLFVTFAVVFFISRIVIFPFFIIRTTMFSMLSYMHPYMTVSEVLSSGVGFPAPWWLYNGLLSTLMCLHMFWFSIIARMAVVFITKGVVEGDARSDGDVDSADSEDSVLATQDDKDTVSNALYRRMSESNTSLGNRRSFIEASPSDVNIDDTSKSADTAEGLRQRAKA